MNVFLLQNTYAILSRPQVVGIVRTVLNTENVPLLLWAARSPDLSPIENVWFMVAERLVLHQTLVTSVDELSYRVEAAWTCVPFHAI
ncbi:hypothetical protein TNCV_770951 [Trichonephila clavipes]|nr:hypothetical protein TNCV_770951 [Trichonephila clavipes]